MKRVYIHIFFVVCVLIIILVILKERQTAAKKLISELRTGQVLVLPKAVFEFSLCRDVNSFTQQQFDDFIQKSYPSLFNNLLGLNYYLEIDNKSQRKLVFVSKGIDNSKGSSGVFATLDDYYFISTLFSSDDFTIETVYLNEPITSLTRTILFDFECNMMPVDSLNISNKMLEVIRNVGLSQFGMDSDEQYLLNPDYHTDCVVEYRFKEQKVFYHFPMDSLTVDSRILDSIQKLLIEQTKNFEAKVIYLSIGNYPTSKRAFISPPPR